ncbi:hypothetical protein [Halalkalicoccus subterraneus]|uniref:hypothetical protein n=1 Tax=Halalkalicoccus subterraneus TaxID=2675002 RepID=UPI001FEB4CBB|nr:hypothetical protein [Halalkalicoccus subterraneus]
MAYLTELDWFVPVKEWERYCNLIYEVWGDTDLYGGIFASQAMRQYIDIDEFAEAEREISDTLQTGGPSQIEKTNATTTPLSEQEKCRVRVGVHPPTKEVFASVARSNGMNPGVMFAYAIREYREGGRMRRIVEKFKKFDEFKQQDDHEQEEECNPTTPAEKHEVICDQIRDTVGLDKNIPEETLVETIEDVAGSSQPTINKYLPDVIDDLELVHHPKNADLYIHESRLEEMGIDPNAPPIDRKPAAVLDRDERVQAIKIELHRNAAAMSVSEIQSSVLDGAWSWSHVDELTTEIANQDGFGFRDTNSSKKILGKSGGSSHQTRSQSSSRSSGTDSTGSDHAQQHDHDQDDNDEREKLTSDAAAEMDVLMNAEVATDGGEDI